MTLDEFIDALNAKAYANPAVRDLYYYTFSAMVGPKYTRIVRREVWDQGQPPKGGSAYCFVDQHGNIYKAAGWKAPAKGVRGHLATVDISKVDLIGSWLYR